MEISKNPKAGLVFWIFTSFWLNFGAPSVWYFVH